ncbi:MAG: HAMP domain-containing histidine kinase [Acidobacteria bacterium]|nr:HAMP domain-containing histidine kinase [Acidobacteriota bacterium]
MKNGLISITRRLVLTVLALEVLSALALITAVAVRERHLEMKAFDATLVGTADSLMGAVQDAEDEHDNVLLDLRDMHLNKNAIYRVVDESGKVLGSQGDVVTAFSGYSSSPGFHNVTVAGRHYRLYVIHGVRVIDPGAPTGGVTHHINILYGMPFGRVWHEVVEAIRFFIFATALLLGITTVVMLWFIKKYLSPLHELAREADGISSKNWTFEAPSSARNTVELRPLTDALEAALARLQRAFEQQRRFTSDAAHELKTDVAIVKSSLQLLSMRRRTQDEYSHGLALSLEDFARLEETVQRMLTLARLEQSPDDTPHSTSANCSLSEAMEEAIHQSSYLARLKTIDIVFTSVTNTVVPLDHRDALLLCSNVLLNALQHSSKESSIHIALEAEAGNMLLTVRDHGEGVPLEDLPYLFEPFYRGDPSRSRKSGGTGLGLSICKAICERVGGAIRISNHDDGGVVVNVTLPVVVAHTAEPSAVPLSPIKVPGRP